MSGFILPLLSNTVCHADVFYAQFGIWNQYSTNVLAGCTMARIISAKFAKRPMAKN